jgi:hypothetical protein
LPGSGFVDPGLCSGPDPLLCNSFPFFLKTFLENNSSHANILYREEAINILFKSNMGRRHDPTLALGLQHLRWQNDAATKELHIGPWGRGAPAPASWRDRNQESNHGHRWEEAGRASSILHPQAALVCRVVFSPPPLEGRACRCRILRVQFATCSTLSTKRKQLIWCATFPSNEVSFNMISH